MKELLYLKDEQLKDLIEKLFLGYRESFSDSKSVLNKYNCRYKLIGHTAYTEGVKIKYSGHVICIDTAMSAAFGKKRNKFDRIHFVEIIKNKILIK